MDGWYENDGDRVGPVPEQELREKFKRQGVLPGARVRMEAMTEWGTPAAFPKSEVKPSTLSAWRWGALALAAFVMIASGLGCVDGEKRTAPASTSSGDLAEGTEMAGTYILNAVEGKPLPHAPMHQGRRGIEVVSGTITLESDGTFVSTMNYGNRPSKWPESRDFKGTYTQEDGALILKWEGAGRTRVTIDGDTLTMNNEGTLFVYQLST